MPLEFGWRANEVRESIWIGDSTLVKFEDRTVLDAKGNPKMGPDKKPVTERVEVSRASVQAIEAWREDGDASHFEPFCDGQPTRIQIRNLTPDEGELVRGLLDGTIPGYERAKLLAFRIAISFPGQSDTIGTADGVSHRIVTKEFGLRMLSNEFVDALKRRYPGIISFYGHLVIMGMFPTDAEKKASSPPPTPTPSSEAAPSTTAATTEASQPAAGA